MRLLPSNLTGSKVPDKVDDGPEVLRRYEITVERETVSVVYSVGAAGDQRCPCCGQAVSGPQRCPTHEIGTLPEASLQQR